MFPAWGIGRLQAAWLVRLNGITVAAQPWTLTTFP
jgi:hypothetical protein